jgi:hypothetical protein
MGCSKTGSIRSVIGRVVLIAVSLLLSAAAVGSAAPTPPTPIPSPNPPPAKTFVGHVAVAHPIVGTGRIPHNPFMASNGLSEIHDDAWQSDVSTWGGPVGRRPQTLSNYLGTNLPPGAGRDCGSITFDRWGRVISICIGLSGPKLFMFDPRTLATLATFNLPPRTAEDVKLNPGAKIFQDFSAGGYFYLDDHDRIVTGTTTGDIYVIGETKKPGFKLLHNYALGLRKNEEITSQLPDSRGLLWFTARQDGVVGTLNFKTGRVHLIRLGHLANGEITKSLATDTHGGVYIPTNHRLYRFVAGRGGAPKVSWSIAYPNDGVTKPGQLDAGTGTTPVLSRGARYVGINDNENPMDVVIYRTAVHPTRVVGRHGRRHRVPERRLVCRVPVFHKNSSAGENAMIAAGGSYIIENNYGYEGPQSLQGGHVSAPGFARVQINPRGTGCRLVWTTYSVSAPSVVSKAALANGLVYTYTTDSHGNWWWTTLSYRTGKVRYKVYAGNGLGYNNNYAGISISPGGAEYLGTLGGIVELRDGTPHPRTS